MPDHENSESGRTANPGYAAAQLAKALTTSEASDDPALGGRAREKVQKWASVLEGMLSGRFAVGSRQPNPIAPVWVTPDVVTGGFVTGQLLAGGPLLQHEKNHLLRLGVNSDTQNRKELNGYFLTEVGLAELTARLRSGCYEIGVPEEGALLVVAWLAANGSAAQARNLIDVLSPHFHALRFYPRPSERAATRGARVFLESVGDTLQRVKDLRPNLRVLAQREAVQVWTPLYVRMVALFLETVTGPVPTIVPDANGRWVDPETRKFAVVGGYPCQAYPGEWTDRARAVLTEIESSREAHRLCRRSADPNDSFARLAGLLKRCVENPQQLTGRDVGMIRLVLARHIAKRGAPDSESARQIRARQLAQVEPPTFHEIARVVHNRLSSFAPNEGLDDVNAELVPVTAEESATLSVRAGTPIPESLRRKASRCLYATVDTLVEQGIITSGETLAQVIPQFTSQLQAAGFEDPHLRDLYSAIYRSFRKRRSLLLLNLESQVRIEELPWIAAVEPYRRKDLGGRELARQTSKEVAILALRAFPEAIVPNKLLQEMGALTKTAQMDLPLVEELAADIFMDAFTPKFTAAAKRAATLLERSLYARYYHLDLVAVRALPERGSSGVISWLRPKSESKGLVAMCIARAGVSDTSGWDVVRNGMIIEQAQILTTHNLAVLFDAFNLAEELRYDLRGMSERCFRWICQRQQVKADKWHATLIMLKNTAYAWRQMVFYLSQQSDVAIREFLEWAEKHLQRQPEDFATRFRPALSGLAAARFAPLADETMQSHGAKRFLGWTSGRHWITGPQSPKASE